MAGDWIKMRSDLYRDPKVSVIAEELMKPAGMLAMYVDQNCQRSMTVTRNVMRNVTVGALVSVWGVMRQRGKRREDDLACDGVSLAVLDDIADIPGFGEAMAVSGWVVQTDSGIEFPHFFEEYNVSPEEKSKTGNAERQRRYRERLKQESDAESNATSNVTRDVTDNVTVTPREEKRREEKVKRATRLPTDWSPSPEDIAYAEKQGLMNGRAQAEVEKFRDWWAAAPGQKGVKADWPATWRTWVRKAVESGQAKKPGDNADIFARSL